MSDAYWLTMNDQVEIYVKRWKNTEPPKAIIQIAHGMAEHIERYDDFANYFVSHGFHVYGNDHRGHGRTGEKQGLLGYFSQSDGFHKVSEDLHSLTKHIKEVYPQTPIFLFGHSMGSFLARKYMQAYSHDIAGVILCGTGYFSRITSSSAKLLASILPAKKESHLMNKLAFGSYNKKIPDHKNGFEWLSQDKQEVQKYADDPFCGFVPTARFFYDLMDGLGHIHRKRYNQMIRKDLPLLIISGDADPVGDYGKGIWKTAKLYHQLGLEQITTMLITSGRHEILNEVNKHETYQAIKSWLDGYLVIV